jgi:hypothetical protein
MKMIDCPIFLISARDDPAHFSHERAAAAHPDARTYIGDTGGVYYAESHALDLAPHISDFLASVRA